MKPARIIFNTFGSLGDLHPYLALAIELKRRGHQPVLATSELYREKVEREGVEFAAVRPDLADLGDEKELMVKIMAPYTGAEFIIKQLLMPHLRATFDDLLALSRDADLMVAHPLSYCMPLIGELTGVRWIGSGLQPMVFLSCYDPPVVGPSPWLARLKFGPRFHRSFLSFAKWIARSWAKPIDRLRAELGLAKSTRHPLFDDVYSPYGNLAMFSEQFAKPQPDWPAHTVITGFPFYDKGMDAAHGQLSETLTQFLAAGEPPVVFTLGSSAVVAAGTFYHESFLAAKAGGFRAVLLVGRDERNRPTGPVPDHICIDDYAPYSLLFPHVAMVVHQGGMGTTAQTLRAGKPMVIMPFSHDQPDHAERVLKLGIGQTISRSYYTAQRIVPVIERLRAPEISRRAAEIGEKIRAEDGVGKACDYLEIQASQASRSTQK